jgi:MYXO-CTERM domain-containing protein
MNKALIFGAALASASALLPPMVSAQTDQTTAGPMATATVNPMATATVNPLATATVNPVTGETENPMGAQTAAPGVTPYTETNPGNSNTGWWGLVGLIGLLGLFGGRSQRR